MCTRSFSTPEEASLAIQGMHGAVIEGLTKDMDGLTVQFEAQGFGHGAYQGVPAAQATQAVPTQQRPASFSG